MDPPYRPPNIFNEDGDQYVPGKVDKGKRKAEGLYRANRALTEIMTSWRFQSLWTMSHPSPITEILIKDTLKLKVSRLQTRTRTLTWSLSPILT